VRASLRPQLQQKFVVEEGEKGRWSGGRRKEVVVAKGNDEEEEEPAPSELLHSISDRDDDGRNTP
jgi:hypothetical protein